MYGRFRLVVLDNDEVSAGELGRQLASHRVDAYSFVDAGEALFDMGTLQPDAVLVAADLASMSSVDVVRVIHTRAGIPAVVGVGVNDGAAAAGVLAAGAAACVPRPYRAEEVIPLLRAIRPDTIGAADPPIEVAGLRLDPATYEVHLHGRLIRLPQKEFRLLHVLMTHPDRLVTRDHLLAVAWTDAGGDNSNTLTVHIKRLRKRLETSAAADLPVIVTVRGLGYRLMVPSRHSSIDEHPPELHRTASAVLEERQA